MKKLSDEDALGVAGVLLADFVNRFGLIDAIKVVTYMVSEIHSAVAAHDKEGDLLEVFQSGVCIAAGLERNEEK